MAPPARTVERLAIWASMPRTITLVADEPARAADESPVPTPTPITQPPIFAVLSAVTSTDPPMVTLLSLTDAWVVARISL